MSGPRAAFIRDAPLIILDEPTASMDPRAAPVLLGETEVPVVDLLAAVLNRVAVEARRVADGQPGTVALTYPATWGPPRLRLLHAAAQATGLAPAVALGPLARNGVSG